MRSQITTPSTWYKVENVSELDSPVLLVYPERVKQNISLVKDIIGNVSLLRPHVKTFKSAEVVRLLMEAGVTKFKCATIAEAEMLAMCNAPDVLLAYQPTLPKLLRFINLIKQYPATNFSCLVDNLPSAKLFSSTAGTEQVVINVFLDLNAGMNRTGIKPGKEASELYEAIAKMPGLVRMGLHAYDGHIDEKDTVERKRLCDEAFEPVELMRTQLKDKNNVLPLLVAGGSPTFMLHAQRENTECSPGTFIFWDKGYSDALPDLPFVHAALVLTRVVSLPGDTKICIDLGHKSIASENELQRRAYFLNAPQLRPVGHSEEHMVLDAGPGHGYQVGDVLYALPIHICPTVALYSNAVCILSGKISGQWQIIARERSIGN